MAARRPGVSFAATPADADAPGGGTATGQVLTDILLYTNPPLTYLAAGTGLAVLGGTHYALRGAHGLTLLTGARRGGGGGVRRFPAS